MSLLEQSLFSLIIVLCPKYRTQQLSQLFRGHTIYQELLNRLSHKHFPMAEEDDEQLLSSDRGDGDQFRWAAGVNNLQYLQHQLNEFFVQVYKGAIEYKINSVAILRGDNLSEACSFLGFILKLYMLESSSATILINALEQIPDQSKFSVLQLIDASLEKKEVTQVSSDSKRRLLDKIDELQEELDGQRTLMDEKKTQIGNLNSAITKLKASLFSKNVQIINSKKEFTAQQTALDSERNQHEILHQLKHDTLRLEKQVVSLTHENTSLKHDLTAMQLVFTENQQLRGKATQTTKLEQKLEQYKDTITQERTEFQNQLQEKDRLLHQMGLKVKAQFEQNKDLEQKCFMLELEKQKLHQEIEVIKEHSAESVAILQIKLNEQLSIMDKLQQEQQQTETCRSSLCVPSPLGCHSLNLEADIMLALEQQKQLDVQEQMEELQNKHQKQVQVMQEKAKTYEAVIANLRNEVQSVQQQKVDVELKLKQQEGLNKNYKSANDDEIHQLLDAKHTESMLLASIVYDLQMKNLQLKGQLNQTIKKIEPRPALRAKN